MRVQAALAAPLLRLCLTATAPNGDGARAKRAPSTHHRRLQRRAAAHQAREGTVRTPTSN